MGTGSKMDLVEGLSRDACLVAVGCRQRMTVLVPWVELVF